MSPVAFVMDVYEEFFALMLVGSWLALTRMRLLCSSCCSQGLEDRSKLCSWFRFLTVCFQTRKMKMNLKCGLFGLPLKLNEDRATSAEGGQRDIIPE